MACDPYRRNPMVKMLWNTFGAVPVLPIEHRLAVFSVLLKERRGFRMIGNLGELCEGGQEKDELERIISSQDPNYIVRSEQYGEITSTVANDFSWSTKLLGLQTGAFIGLEDLHSWKIHVPSYQSVSSKSTAFQRAIEMFRPDYNNLYFNNAKRKSLDLWIVSEVITVPSLELKALDGKGGHAAVSASFPSLVPLPVDVSLSIKESGQQTICISGPDTGSGVRPFPVAFKGWRFRYEHGILKSWKPSKAQADGPGDAAPGPSTRQEDPEEIHHPSPYTDSHMQDFVEDEWFASILQD